MAVVIVTLTVLATIAMLDESDAPGAASERDAAFNSSAQQIQRGAYLARAGNCAACHTARGGADYAGGRGIATPFGVVHSSNLTPDFETGLGRWTAADFWRAMHHGRSKDGRLLYPAFPYPNYTQVTREDADALYAFLRSLPPVARAATPHALSFPYNTQASLVVWRALFFKPGAYQPEPMRSSEWNRGAYLVRGLGHCNACHANRNAFGATSEKLELSGGLIPMQNWYAPSLASSREAGVADWDTQQIIDLLKTGVSPRGSVLGPMAEVVYRSTQHLTDADLHAMAVFLKDLPQGTTPRPRSTAPATAAALVTQGAKLYELHCVRCHGDQGQGAAGAYPPLAGNRAVTMDSPANLIRVVIHGGFPPATGGNPRPYGMPPLGQVLSDAEIAAVVSYIRASWSNLAAPVTPLDVLRYR